MTIIFHNVINIIMKDSDLKLWHQFTERLKATFSAPFYVRQSLHEDRFVMDLHGMFVNDAYKNVDIFLRESSAKKIKYVTVITGKSGQIRQEFPTWISTSSYVKRTVLLNGGGAFKIYLK